MGATPTTRWYMRGERAGDGGVRSPKSTFVNRECLDSSISVVLVMEVCRVVGCKEWEVDWGVWGVEKVVEGAFFNVRSSEKFQVSGKLSEETATGAHGANWAVAVQPSSTTYR